MAMSPAIHDREMDKFVEAAGETAVRVQVVGGGGGGITQAEAQAAFEAALIAQQQNLPNLTLAEVQTAVSNAINSGATLANLQQQFEDALVAQVNSRLDAISNNTDQVEPKLDNIISDNNFDISKYHYHRTILDGSDKYYFFATPQAASKYLVMYETDISATENSITYANISNNPTILDLSSAISNFNTLTFGDIYTLTGL